MIIGTGMAMGQYEALFATLDLRFATTVPSPLLALAIEQFGWHAACMGYGILLMVAVAPLYLWVLPAGHHKQASKSTPNLNTTIVDRRLYLVLGSIFALGASLVCLATCVLPMRSMMSRFALHVRPFRASAKVFSNLI